MKTRGIVITDDFGSLDDGSGLQIRGGVSPSDLRHYLLYWDRIDYPTSLVSFGSLPPESEILEAEGILSKTSVQCFDGGSATFTTERNGADLFRAETQLESYEKNNAKADELWTISQPSPKLILPEVGTTEARIAEIELYRSLPVPDHEVAIEDILRFKEDRRDELKSFRAAMDDLYLEIANSADTERSIARAVQKVEDSLVAIDKLMTERRWKRFFPDTKVSLDLKDLAMGVAVGTAVGWTFGLATIGASIGLVGSALSVKFDLSIKPDSMRWCRFWGPVGLLFKVGF